MEEDTHYRIRFSSLCFINEHVGFQGTIKSSPGDFIVIEIDEQGQLVNKAIDEPINAVSKIPELNNFAKKPKLDLQNLSFEDGSYQELNTLSRCSDGDQNHQSNSEKEDTISDRTSKCEEENADVLNFFLDEKTNELLNQFACDVKEKWNSETELIGPSPEFSLGRILDKNQRAILHSAIRQKFPFLITVGKNSEVVIKPNLEYKELCHLVSEEEALDFFKYLDAKKENSKFTFKPDANKDHRKAVHHFVNKKFGNLVETKSFPEQTYSACDPNVVITVRFREKTKHKKRSLLECQERKVIYTGNNKGFVNYYGPQRFGKGRKVHTDQIGLALLKNEMVKAIKLFLTPEDLDDPVNRAKKYFLQTEDAKGTLSLMPEFKVRERALLEALHRFGMTEEGCIQAWFSFPHSMRLFYIHAYSSKIWNEAASYRLETYGSRVVEGDLVCLDEDVDEHFPSTKVHLVTKEEESANTYTIHQVVLPVLGYNIQYPKNQVGQWYQETLSRDGLQTCRFKVPTLKLNVPGCYRQILKHAHNLSYQLMGDHDVKMEGSHIDESTLSLLISFNLDASCYATVCLREVMKYDI
ncbi:pseudouridylate synthase PUS7L [Marmota marmota marmota]|uniref:pseudouridylate synthase PUS7L n=1 Tax=Marmota marmota marmota TaxID=9994 RepID=UPI00209330C5|nr:pseudouridylate synthase PUS7L [Marmota marmota marmota]